MRNRKLLSGKQQRQAGFTLLEIIVVVSILVLLAGVVIVRMGGAAEQAKRDTTKVRITEISKALEMYKLDNGFYPTTEQGLQALAEMPETSPEPKKWKKYVDTVPKDAWENEFIYLQPGTIRDFDLISKGEGGVEGDEDDITNYTQEEKDKK